MRSMKGLAHIRVPNEWLTGSLDAEQALDDAARRTLAKVLGARGDEQRIGLALGDFYETWCTWEAVLPDYNGVPVAAFFRAVANASDLDATELWEDAQWAMAGHTIMFSVDIGISPEDMDALAVHVQEGILGPTGYADVEGVGRFELRTRPGSSHMNASTGQPVFLPPRREVHFRPLRSLNTALRVGALTAPEPGHPRALQTILLACIPGDTSIYADGLGWFILKRHEDRVTLRFRASAELTEAFTQL